MSLQERVCMIFSQPCCNVARPPPQFPFPPQSPPRRTLPFSTLLLLLRTWTTLRTLAPPGGLFRQCCGFDSRTAPLISQSLLAACCCIIFSLRTGPQDGLDCHSNKTGLKSSVLVICSNVTSSLNSNFHHHSKLRLPSELRYVAPKTPPPPPPQGASETKPERSSKRTRRRTLFRGG